MSSPYIFTFQVSFTSLDYPGATEGTSAFGINDQGQIVGVGYGSSNGPPYDAFVYANGTYTTINDSAIDNSNSSYGTFPQSIDDSGTIVGYAGTPFIPLTSAGPASGFSFAGGTFTAYSYTGTSNAETYFESINNQENEIVGFYNAILSAAPTFVGLIYENGSYQTFTAGPAGNGSFGGTMAFGVNNQGQVVGTYQVQNDETPAESGNSQGFIYQNGQISFLNFPSALQTDVRGINDEGLIVGYYEDPESFWHGFVYNDNTGSWATINAPGASGTYIYGINDSDQIVGTYVDGNANGSLPSGGNPSANGHGFEATLPSAAISPPALPSSSGNVDEWLLQYGQWAASAQPGSHPAGYQVAGVGDFTGGGTDGILWYDASTGDVDEWKIAYGAWAGSIDLGTHPGNYQIAGVGDFTGNGTDDVLWTSVSGNGQVQTDIWELSNGQWAASVSPGAHPAGYQVAGTGDFTGNGTDGILWYDSSTGNVDEWQLSDGQWADSVDLGAHPIDATDGVSYQIAGIGDFTGNGIDDILWTSVNSNGTIATDIWELGSNGQWAASKTPGLAHPAGYEVVGVGNFTSANTINTTLVDGHELPVYTGYGTDDILWYNPTTGDIDEWLIKNGQWTGSVDLGVHPGNFQIAGIGDFTGSGTSDILWHSNT